MTNDVVDAHVHLWSVTQNDWYPALRQMADELHQPDLYRDFLPGDYRSAAGDLSVTAYVHVSATTAHRTYLHEQRWVEQLAQHDGLQLATIGTVDPSMSARDIVCDLERQAESEHFRGVRVLYDFPPTSDAARVVLDWLNARDYVFDLATQPPEIPGWLATLDRYPDLTVVLEHCGWPTSTEDAAREQWSKAIRACAERTNALCKVSGLGMATGDLSSSALQPWVEGTIDAFGWDRVAFGSNMPIESMAGSYRQLFESLQTILSSASPEEIQAFYSTNARRYYTL